MKSIIQNSLKACLENKMDLNILKSWHCFATPLVFENEIIGYLDVSTLNVDMKNEIKIIAELLPYKIIVSMHDSKRME